MEARTTVSDEVNCSMTFLTFKIEQQNEFTWTDWKRFSFCSLTGRCSAEHIYISYSIKCMTVNFV